jgi:hypothetical protein
LDFHQQIPEPDAYRAALPLMEVQSVFAQVERTTAWGEENKRWKLFITRFYDCETCWTADGRAGNMTACIQAFRRHYEFAYCRFLRCPSPR